MLREIARVLKKGAVLISVSINSPEKFRVALGEEGAEVVDWVVEETAQWAQGNPNNETPIAVYMHKLVRR